MTIDPFLFLQIFLGLLLGLAAFFFARYILFRYGFKDRRYPIVQHAERRVPPPPKQSQFLPGSHFEEEETDDTFEVEHIMDEGLSLTKLEQEKHPSKTHPILGNLKELRRAFLLDDLLNRKWDK